MPHAYCFLQRQIRQTEAQITTNALNSLLLHVPKTICVLVEKLYADQQSVAVPASVIFVCVALLQHHYDNRFYDNQVKLHQQQERVERRTNNL